MTLIDGWTGMLWLGAILGFALLIASPYFILRSILSWIEEMLDLRKKRGGNWKRAIDVETKGRVRQIKERKLLEEDVRPKK